MLEMLHTALEFVVSMMHMVVWGVVEFITVPLGLLVSIMGLLGWLLLLGLLCIIGAFVIAYVRAGARIKAPVLEERVAVSEDILMPQLPPHDTIVVATEKIKKVVLSNGLTVLVCQQRSAPKVLVQIGYNVGSAIETAGERGLAHLLEHMIFKGTGKLSESDIDAIGRKYGADFNAFTSYDMTSYFFEIDSQNWRHFLPLLADCMQNATFSDQHLASEVKAVIQELRMYKDSTMHMMYDHAFKTLFPGNHPYHSPIIGYKEDLAELSGERLRAFYEKYYHPSRAVLCIVGDIDIDEALTQARDAFEGITCRASDHQPAFIPLHNTLVATAATMYKEVHDEQLCLYWRIPGMAAKNHIAVSAVEYMLGGGLDSRLYRVLVDEKQIAMSVRVHAEQMLDAGIMVMVVEPKKDKTDACRLAIVAEIQRVLSEGFTALELYKMVKNRQRQHMLALHSVHDFVYYWLESYFITRDEYAFFNEVNAYAEVTLPELQDFCAQWLDPRDMHSLVIVPLPESAKAIWAREQDLEEEYYEYLLERHQRTEPVAEPSYVHTLPPAQPLSFAFPQPTRVNKQLQNELTIISYTDRSLPLVSVALIFKDAAYIARALTGVGVDLMMAMLLEGSKTLSKRQLIAFFDINGAQYSYTGRGMSVLVGASSFSAVFSHAMKVLTQPAFTQEAFEKIRDIFVHSYTQKKDSARQVAMRALKQAVYYKHPYGWSFDEAIAYLNHLTLSDIEALYKEHVLPSHMVLSVAGDVDPAFVEQLAMQVSVGWEGGHYVAPVYPERQTPPLKEATVPMLRDQTVLVFGRPSAVTLYEPGHILLDLLSHICFNSLGSRLFVLRERTGLFYTASGAWGADIHQEQGYDYVSAIVSPENLVFARTEIVALIAGLQKGDFTADELAAARQMYSKEMIDAAADIRSLASLFANIETLGIGYEYYDKALKYTYDVSLDEINAYARHYISTESFYTVVAGRVSPDGRHTGLDMALEEEDYVGRHEDEE